MYVNFVCDSLVKLFGTFNHIKHKVIQRVVRQLYYGFIYSKIAYSLEVYGYTSVSVSKIQTMQNKLLKLILEVDIRTQTNTVHKMLNILKIEDIHKIKLLAVVNSCVIKKMSCNLNSFIKNIQYNTRQVEDLDVPSSWTGYGDWSLKVDCAKKWNNMEANMKPYRKKVCLRRKLMANCISQYRCEMN